MNIDWMSVAFGFMGGWFWSLFIMRVVDEASYDKEDEE